MSEQRIVADVMTRDPVTLSPSLSLKQMDELLVRRAVSGAPVVEKGELVGVASRTDVLRQLLEDQEGASRVSDFYASPFPIALPVLERLSAEARSVVRRMSSHHVRDIMSPRIVTVAADAGVVDAAQKMSRENVHRLPVLEDGHLVGIVTSLDLVREMARAGPGGA